MSEENFIKHESSIKSIIDELNLPNVNLKALKPYIAKLQKKAKDDYKISDLDNAIQPISIVERAIQYYAEDNNIKNPYVEYQKPLLRNHKFFEGKSCVCASPYTSLRFDFGGKMTVCCVNRDFIIGTYPQDTPMQAWFGKKIKELRESLDDYDFSKGCNDCARNILKGNGENSIIALNESLGLSNYINSKFPTQLIFQLHNTCNYECIMCGGEFSSSIRKNRECLPPIPNAYDDSFLDKIKLFLQKARMVSFIGGEPLLLPINIKIMELLSQINPNVKIDLVSNGSVYSSKIEALLKSLPNCTVNISIDSVNPETYKNIRRNGKLETVIKNIDSLISIDRMGTLSMCVIIQNVYEVHDFIEFCEKRNREILFNNVDVSMGITMYNDTHENGNAERDPIYTGKKIPEFRLWKLPMEEKLKIKDYLLSKKYDDNRQDKINSIINFIMSNHIDN